MNIVEQANRELAKGTADSFQTALKLLREHYADTMSDDLIQLSARVNRYYQAVRSGTLHPDTDRTTYAQLLESYRMIVKRLETKPTESLQTTEIHTKVTNEVMKELQFLSDSLSLIYESMRGWMTQLEVEYVEYCSLRGELQAQMEYAKHAHVEIHELLPLKKRIFTLKKKIDDKIKNIHAEILGEYFALIENSHDDVDILKYYREVAIYLNYTDYAAELNEIIDDLKNISSNKLRILRLERSASKIHEITQQLLKYKPLPL